MSHERTNKGGSYKGKRDKHEGVQHNSARRSDGWEKRNGKRDRGIVEQVMDFVFGNDSKRR